jgi:uncharacterized protein
MDFEWDDEKYRQNLHKHGVDFVEAMLIFENDVLSFEDKRQNYGEQRFRSIGMVGGNCFVVVHTQRGDTTRLISAWKGGSDERDDYRSHVLRGS